MPDHDAQRSLVVSIHDVRPGLFARVERMLEVLDKLGVRQTSLLVIPNFHREEPLERHPEKVQALKRLQTAGHELVLHALYHREDAPPRQNAWQYMMSRHYTSGEGEFYRLPYQEAGWRLRQGLELFASLGLRPPHGFTAPAWLYSKAAVAAVRDNGLRYLTTLWGVRTFAPEGFIKARAVVWSHRAPWRRATSNAFLPPIAYRLMLLRRPLRLALHPPDFDYPRILDCATAIVKRALDRGYRPTTYRDLVTRLAPQEALTPDAAAAARKAATPPS